MRKAMNENNLEMRSTRAGLAALSLSFALAVFGCTTNKMPGNGQPELRGPGYGGTPGTMSVPGSSSGTEPIGHLVAAGPAGMTSASIDALTTAAEDRAYRGQVLGSESPGPNPYAGEQLQPTGQFISPSLTANPELTANASISSAPVPIVTSGAGDLGAAEGLFFATAAANAPGVVGAPGTGAGVTSSLTSSVTLSPITVGTISPAPVFTTPMTVATPTNTANVLVPGQFAAGVGGSATLAGNSVAAGSTLANPGPLALAPGTFLGNANTGTLNPTITSALTPNPTVAANPPVVINNAPIFPAGPRATATATAPVTSPQSIGVITIGGGTAAQAANAIVNANANAAAAAGSTSGIVAPITVGPMMSSSRNRAVGRVTSMTAPATVSSRTRAVRLTTAPNGTIVITNR